MTLLLPKKQSLRHPYTKPPIRITSHCRVYATPAFAVPLHSIQTSSEYPDAVQLLKVEKRKPAVTEILWN